MEWVRIPDKTKVQHRHEKHYGVIDGLTEIIAGGKRNPDFKTLYRVYIGQPQRALLAEEDLLILLDDSGLIIMEKEPVSYRRSVTERLRAALPEGHFTSVSTAKVPAKPKEVRQQDQQSPV